MTTPIPTPHYDSVGNAALDLEAFVRDLSRKYTLTAAEQLDVLTIVLRSIIRAAEREERKEQDVRKGQA
jgi:hypothetical protein